MNMKANKEIAVSVNTIVIVKVNKMVGKMQLINEKIKEGQCFR